MGKPQHPAELAIVTMPPEIDLSNAGRVGDDLAVALVPGVVAVVADMTGTTFCDSPAVTVLVRAHLRAIGHHAELRLVTRSRAVLRALAIAMVDYSLPVYPSLAAALVPRPAKSIRASQLPRLAPLPSPGINPPPQHARYLSEGKAQVKDGYRQRRWA